MKYSCHKERTSNVLAAWHILLLCEQRSLSATTVSMHPKVYLYDIGLAKQLREVSIPALSLVETLHPQLRTSLGVLMENSIYLGLQQGKNFLNTTSGWRMKARRDVEVDFVVKVGELAVPIEVKATARPTQHHLAPICQYLQASAQNFGILVSSAPYCEFEQDSMRVINLSAYACSREALELLMD